jgi:hypothetical protein
MRAKSSDLERRPRDRSTPVRPIDVCDLCRAGASAQRGRHGCSCAPGTRESSCAFACWAGTSSSRFLAYRSSVADTSCPRARCQDHPSRHMGISFRATSFRRWRSIQVRSSPVNQTPGKRPCRSHMAAKEGSASIRPDQHPTQYPTRVRARTITCSIGYGTQLDQEVIPNLIPPQAYTGIWG